MQSSPAAATAICPASPSVRARHIAPGVRVAEADDRLQEASDASRPAGSNPSFGRAAGAARGVKRHRARDPRPGRSRRSHARNRVGCRRAELTGPGAYFRAGSRKCEGGQELSPARQAAAGQGKASPADHSSQERLGPPRGPHLQNVRQARRRGDCNRRPREDAERAVRAAFAGGSAADRCRTTVAGAAAAAARRGEGPEAAGSPGSGGRERPGPRRGASAKRRCDRTAIDTVIAAHRRPRELDRQIPRRLHLRRRLDLGRDLVGRVSRGRISPD